MDAHALKKLSRSELQKLAKRDGIKANAKSEAIIAQLIKKYPGGVPRLVAPVPRGSARRRTVSGRAESDGKEGEDEDATTMPKTNEETVMSEARKEGANVEEANGGTDLASTSASQADIEPKPATPIKDLSEGQKELATLGEPNKPASGSGTSIKAPVGPTARDETPNMPSPKTPEASGSTSNVDDHKGDTPKSGSDVNHPTPITGRLIAGRARVARYLNTPSRVSATNGGQSSSSPQLTTPAALAFVANKDSEVPHNPVRENQGSSPQSRTPTSANHPIGSPDTPRPPHSGASTDTSFPSRRTPSPVEERGVPTEARAKYMLIELGKKVKEVQYWRRELADAKYLLETTQERNKRISEEMAQIQKRRKVAERFYMTMLKKDERLHNGAKSWRPQQSGEPERDYSYVAEESEEVDTSDYVAESDVSTQSGSSKGSAVEGDVHAGVEQKV